MERDVTDNKIEEVALAIFWRAERLDPTEQSGPLDDLEHVFMIAWPPSLSERDREFQRHLARAAIKAMQNPTQEMIDAAGDDFMDDYRDRYQSVEATWHTMIGVALK